MRKEVWLIVALGVLTACGFQVNGAEPTNPPLFPPTSPAGEHTPTPQLRLPPKNTPTVLYESPTPTPIRTPTPRPPDWCEGRLPARYPTDQEKGRKNVNLFGTSFFHYFQLAINADESISKQVRDITFTWNVYQGEDTASLRTHLPEMAGKFQVLIGENNQIWNHLGAIGTINGRDSDIVVNEIDQIADEEAACYPEVDKIFFSGPIPTKRDSSPGAQRILTNKLTAREAPKGRAVIDLVTPLTRGNPLTVRTELYGDDLHLNTTGYKVVLPSILYVINGAPANSIGTTETRVPPTSVATPRPPETLIPLPPIPLPTFGPLPTLPLPRAQ
ncbi:hypothetical protein HY086_00275 [Candidatus Gottesmanbacteria bacterium]|nr:hypothetical protein [Candidatus Gottesmanbacteria bacterium]